MPADIVWINGAFAAGKTTTAQLLALRWPAAIVVDPEIWGTLLRRWIPAERHVDDFQDLHAWRRQTRHGLAGLVQDTGRTLIVPMTLWKLDHFDEIVGGLRSDGLEVAHFCLLASRNTLIERCRQRQDDTFDWVTSQHDLHGTNLTDPRLQHHVETDERSAQDVADLIVSRLSA